MAIDPTPFSTPDPLVADIARQAVGAAPRHPLHIATDYASRHEITTQTIISVVLIALGILLYRAIAKGVAKRSDNLEAGRSLLIRTRHIITITLAVCLAALWGTELKHAVLSLAALGAATIIATREVFMAWMGSLFRAASRPFEVGDTIEIASFRGEVVDIGALSFTVLELGNAFQATGISLVVPNALLFTSTIRNLSHPGGYVVHFTRIGVDPRYQDLLAHRDALLEAGSKACSAFEEPARASLAHASRKLMANTPSSTPCIAIEPHDSDRVDLVLRYPCPKDGRVRLEQTVLAEYYAAARKLNAAMPAKHHSA